jgi:2-isopropylmalate synthase
MSRPNRIALYDTTLRDGTQGLSVSLSLPDKLLIAQKLDEIGFDYIEGGYPLSNPKDATFFDEIKSVRLQHAKIAAFGMTRRKGITAEKDEGMKSLLDAETPVVTIVGKSWDLHVKEVINVSEEENIAMIADTVRLFAEAGREVVYDAEHFFDGYAANPEYALQTIMAAQDAGATCLCLCDTNGGSLPERVSEFVAAIKPHTSIDLGIHTHNDSGMAVANTLAAIHQGAVHAQGTINGIGERCGNVDLITVAANLALKLKRDVLVKGGLSQLTELSRFVDEIANLHPRENQPYVGTGAFAHKGGMHVHAVRRVTRSYEHVPPDAVGNDRQIVISEVAGTSAVADKVGKKYGIEKDREKLQKIMLRVQDMENAGYMFEAAEASFDLLCRREVGLHQTFFKLHHYRVVLLNLEDKIQSTEAILKMSINETVEHRVAEGDGPVDALSGALWKALRDHYPVIDDIKLADYKVRVVNAKAGTAARVRVVIEFHDTKSHGFFTTVGVHENILQASWNALVDGVEYKLLQEYDKANGGPAVPRPKPVEAKP